MSRFTCRGCYKLSAAETRHPSGRRSSSRPRTASRRGSPSGAGSGAGPGPLGRSAPGARRRSRTCGAGRRARPGRPAPSAGARRPPGRTALMATSLMPLARQLDPQPGQGQEPLGRHAGRGP